MFNAGALIVADIVVAPLDMPPREAFALDRSEHYFFKGNGFCFLQGVSRMASRAEAMPGACWPAMTCQTLSDTLVTPAAPALLSAASSIRPLSRGLRGSAGSGRRSANAAALIVVLFLSGCP